MVSTMTTTTTSMSFRGFAKVISVAHSAVCRAARTGRLDRSLGHDPHGRRCIADVELAKREWLSGASKPAPERVHPDGGPVDDLLFAMLAYFAHEAARSTVTKWRGSCPIEIDLGALRRWLRDRGYRGEA